jgi:hypothetical protein
VAFEREGIPCVLVATTAFERQALFEGRFVGASRIRLLIIPHPFGSLVPEQVDALAERTVDEIITLLAGEPGRSTVAEGATA